uniref:Uncharacterized protein n=1 Tax=Romanomermis culicivorax TaxID=13658 RepID=A0A915K3S4_ROMCU
MITLITKMTVLINRPTPQSGWPLLLVTTVKFWLFLRTRASIKFSGMPQIPNPPSRIDEPSRTSSTAWAVESKNFVFLSARRLVLKKCRKI